MAPRLFERIARLIKADAHGIVESLEERSLLLEQYLREAERALDHKRARLAALRDDNERLREALAAEESEIRSLDEDVDLAIGGGKDDLARFAIRRLIPKRSRAKALRAQLEQCRAEEESLTEKLSVQEGQLEALRARVRNERARASAADATPAWLGEVAVADEEVEIELMRRRAEGGVS